MIGSPGPGSPMSTAAAARRLPVHVMTKPIGPICNLDCAYCYYLDKEGLFPRGERFRMSDELLETYVRQYIEARAGPEVAFTWQGGEPTLMGLPFFRRVVELQRRLAPPGVRVSNAIQTNGTLIDREWAIFLRDEGFLVGVSLDGPPQIHDTYRVDKHGGPTSAAVEAGLRLLLEAGVDVNVLCVVNRRNAERAREVYAHLVALGVRHLQFIPLVEPVEGDPAAFEAARGGAGVSERSVLPDAFGAFLLGIFEVWLRRDVGRVFVQTFEETLTSALGLRPSLCIFNEECGRGLAMEHNGDLFSCDHFVDPAHRLGNIRELPIIDLAALPQQEAFGRAKRETLPDHCRRCEVRSFCHGECPKNRIILTPDGEPGLNYLCVGYRRYFNAVRPWLGRIAALLGQGRPARLIVDEVRAADRAAFGSAGRNDDCPCGSGRKFKRCCMVGWTAGEPVGLPPILHGSLGSGAAAAMPR
ncbi:MAG: anaerobic sulfatase maturase [Candidatus Limnocylindrales bacterium]